ncbi:ABC transporter permease [Kaistia dalseonensis]|uniref:Peptide/nickel transport system permease protein n=1 Tax=Kaistia dalseonensis TaxID=410840 RepID=A0ABU0H482_9HYPH|nr:ABC transporter permease [Kaistia dalseonensis]MCX5493722.1 ABC transporter permease [Kaistia dalseonensis]MDQ0436286.1 peptide/nickel transport system permease protein [Kaistia dalseonensis]
MALTSLPGALRLSTSGMRSPLSIRLAMLWLVAVLAIGIFAPLLAPHDYLHQSPLERFLQPWFLGGTPTHLFGTDYLGRDVLSNLLMATRTSLVVAILGSLICALLGTALGFTAAHFGGTVDNLIMGFSDAMASVPFIIFALAVLAFFGSDPLIFIGLVGVASWERYARLTRGLVLDAATNGYAEAVRITGAAPLRIYLRHILPNIIGPLVVQLTINFPEIILLESGLSFLGLGIQPPLTSLGLMVAEGRDYVAIAWWLCALPGIVILLTTLAVSLAGDHLRDRFDARLR